MQVVVFDIDETTLSNKATFFTAPDAAAVRSLRSAASDVAGAEGAAPVASALTAAQRFKGPWGTDSPPLEAMLDLYHHLRALNYSTAFLTGRGEDGRDATAANLLRAGYGRPCHASGVDGAMSADDVAKELLISGGAGAEREPCYVRLLMRGPGDQRLASVYKPSAREILTEAGFDIVGNFGVRSHFRRCAVCSPYRILHE